jgi:hypothetical protein
MLVRAVEVYEKDRLGFAFAYLVAVAQRSGVGVVVSFDKALELRPDGTAESAGPAPYLDYRPPTRDEAALLAPVLDEPWLATGAEELAVEHGMSEHFAEVRERTEHSVQRVRSQVRQRLTQEINYWDARHAELLDRAAAGQSLKIKPETAHRRARDLERRLERRLAELDADEALRPLPPAVAGGALVVPYGLLQRLAGARDEPVATYAKQTAKVERRAVAAVMAAERRLGRPVQLARDVVPRR